MDYASHSAHVEALESRLLEVLGPIAPSEGEVPFFSTVEGAYVDGRGLDAGYWYRNLRQTVQLESAVRELNAEGYGAFVEVSPHPVLVTAVQETVEAADGTAVVAGSLRRDEGGLERFLTSAAELFVRGVPVDWKAVLPAGPPVELPTYAFQRQRFWLEPGGSTGDLGAVGLGGTGHPLLGAAVHLPGGGAVLTGRLSLKSHPWLADHAVHGAVLLPGTAFVELAVRAGDETGCDVLEELTLEAPLVLPVDGAVQVQVAVEVAEEAGHRTLSIHSRPGDAVTDEPWTRHATGALTAVTSGPAGSESGSEPGFGLGAWPPPEATPLTVDGLYDRLDADGLAYGPAFRGLRAAWRRGDEVFAEVAVPDGLETGGFGLHPALLDAALHALGLGGLVEDTGAVLLPFAWNGVRLLADGASGLRVRLTRTAGTDAITLLAVDGAGAPVVAVDSLVLRPASRERLDAGDHVLDSLYRLDWTPVAQPVAGEHENDGGHAYVVVGDVSGLGLGSPVPAYADFDALAGAAEGSLPDTVVMALPSGDAEGTADAVRATTHRTLALLQQWLADAHFADVRLVLVGSGAVPVGEGRAVPDPAQAAAWGLVRSAQAEHPGRFVLVDLDRPEAADLLLPALACNPDEPQLALHEGKVLTPRLAPATSGDGLLLPAGSAAWRVEAGTEGSLDGLHIVSAPEAVGPLGVGEVRVGVRAAGVNFRDVLMSLGMYPGVGVVGGEAAGVVLEVGSEVEGLVPGDRVMGLFAGAFGPVAVADHRMLVRVPDGWSFAAAASVPAVFATAFFALVDLGGVG
ncbi:Mycocerosate synthase, partial [Actinobacteria bacterium OK074]